ncbi:MAG: TatD family hydrolase [Candidatus Babeliales bacterium]
MLVDTHCHMNMMVKSTFDRLLTPQEITAAHAIIEQATHHDVTTIINVGTSLIESLNCITLARTYQPVWASVGIHPNDCTPSWRTDISALEKHIQNKEINKIVAIGECGLDRHYPDYDLQRQKDAFKAQIELALEYDCALIVHTRDAADETLKILEEFKGQIARGIIHCFSEDQSFANTALEFGFSLGFGGTLTYPKNAVLRAIAVNVPLESIVLETDAPFLPPQFMRGKQNHPEQIKTVATYLAELRSTSYEAVAEQTTATALRIFNLVS